MVTDRSVEARLRRKAEAQGLVLRKSRARYTQATEFGKIWLIDPDNVCDGCQQNVVVAEFPLPRGKDGRAQQLNQIEEWLDSSKEERS